MLLGLLMSLAGAGAPPPSVCTLADTPPGSTVTVAGEIRLEGASPIQSSQGLDPPPARQEEPGRLILTSPACPDVTVTVSMSPRFNQSILAFAFYMTLDMPHYRSGEEKQRVTLRGTWRADVRRLDGADLLEME